jgi:hypothetical protein
VLKEWTAPPPPHHLVCARSDKTGQGQRDGPRVEPLAVGAEATGCERAGTGQKLVLVCASAHPGVQNLPHQCAHQRGRRRPAHRRYTRLRRPRQPPSPRWLRRSSRKGAQQSTAKSQHKPTPWATLAHRERSQRGSSYQVVHTHTHTHTSLSALPLCHHLPRLTAAAGEYGRVPGGVRDDARVSQDARVRVQHGAASR